VSLRGRIGLLTALAVGVTVLAAALITYALVGAELRGQVDDALTAQADLARAAARANPGVANEALPVDPQQLPLPPPSFGAPTAIQIIRRGGEVVRLPTAQVELPVTARDRAVADGRADFFSEREADGTRLRVYTFSPLPGVVVQLARSLDGVDDALARMRLVLGGALLLAVIAGGLLGRLFAERALRPVADLTDAVEHVELTGDLSPGITAGAGDRRDEVGRLAARFDAMLTRLRA
jgi:two-component system sensor histidine kinase MprB